MNADPMPDQPPTPSHAICGAKTRSGAPCTQRPMRGQKRCKMHGGKTPRGLAAGARRIAEMEAALAVSKFGGPVDVSPAEALLHLVQTKASEVAFWQARVAELDDDELTWGRESTEVGVGPEGLIDKTTHKAAPHVALTLLHKTQDQLAAYSAAALKAGVDERMVRLAEAQGAVMVRIIDTVVAGILQASGATLAPDVVSGIVTAAIDQEATA